MAVAKDPLYEQLWNACAGPLVTLPQVEERVYYFPQGHMEQVRGFRFCQFCAALCLELYLFMFWEQIDASTNQGADQQQMPQYNLPSKILCKVIDIQLQVCFSLILVYSTARSDFGCGLVE